MRLNIFVNEMASFGPFSAFIKGCIAFCSSGRNGDRPTRRDDNPQGMEYLPLRDMSFLNNSCPFVLCVVCNVMELFNSR